MTHEPSSDDAFIQGEIPDDWIKKMAASKSRLIRNARIVRIDKISAWFGIGSKFESSIPLSQWHNGPAPQVGDELNILIQDDCELDDRPLKIIRVESQVTPAIADWSSLIHSIAVGSKYSGRLARRIPGGFLVDIGINTFLPDECVNSTMQATPDDWLGKNVNVQVTDIDATCRRIRVALDAE